MGIIEFDFKSLKAKLANSDLSSSMDQGKKVENQLGRGSDLRLREF